MSLGLLFFALLGLALAVWWLARRGHAATGLPAGRLIYSDTTRWQPVKRPFFSRSHRLTGRPDYLVRQGADLIPVEVKSGQAPSDGPYASHILQLAAYCLLVEEEYGRRPSHGIVLYADANQTFEVDYTSALEEELLWTLDEMRFALIDGDAPRDHDQIVRCRACSYQSSCDQRLN